MLRLYEQGESYTECGVVIEMFRFAQTLEDQALAEVLAPESLPIAQQLAAEILAKRPHLESYDVMHTSPDAPAYENTISIPRTFIDELSLLNRGH